MFKVSGENKHFSENRPETNDLFYDLKEWFINKILLKEELKEIRFGFGYHYCKIIPPFSIFWRYTPKRMNSKKLVFKTKHFEMEAEQNDWESIDFEKNQVDIEGTTGYGIYFVFKKPILMKYKQQLKILEKEKHGKML